MERKLGEVHPLLTLCGTIVENWQGNPIQKESLRVFFLVLQVTHYLDAGQVRSSLWSEQNCCKGFKLQFFFNTRKTVGQNACHLLGLGIKEDVCVCKATRRFIMSLHSQVKSVKPCLKQLQQCIQTISTLHDDEILPSNPADLFHWLPKEHMCVLVYLVMLLLFLCHVKAP